MHSRGNLKSVHVGLEEKVFCVKYLEIVKRVLKESSYT